MSSGKRPIVYIFKIFLVLRVYQNASGISSAYKFQIKPLTHVHPSLELPSKQLSTIGRHIITSHSEYVKSTLLNIAED